VGAELGIGRPRRLRRGRGARHDSVMAREIVLDTETTGFDPLTGDRLVELAALEIESFVPTGRSFHVYIDPGRDVLELHQALEAVPVNPRPVAAS